MKEFIVKNFISLRLKLTSEHYLLIAIFLTALFLRTLGVYPGFPPNHPDEPTIYGSIKQLFLYGEFKPVLYSYGGFLYELYSLIIALVFVPFSFITFLFSNLDEINLRGIAGFIESYKHSQLLTSLNVLYWSRYLTAILGSLTIVTVYFLGKELFNKRVGLLAAFLLAINYRHVLSSVFVLSDAPAGFFATLSVLSSVYLIKKPSVSFYLLSGLTLGLALSVKYFVYVVPAFLFCHLISVFINNKKSLPKKIILIFISKNLFICLSISLLVFFIINPFVVFDFDNFYHEYQYDSARFGVTSPIASLLNYNYHKSLVGLYHLVRYGIGDLLSLVIVVGYFYSLLRKTKSTLILSSIVLPFFIVFLIIAAPSSARYYTSIMPFLLLFSSFFIIDILDFIKIRSIKFLLFALILLVLSFPSLRNSYLTSLYFSWPQNLTLASKWLEDNLPKKSTVAVSAVSLPLTKNLKEIDINPVGPTTFMAMDELRENHAEFIAVSSFYTSVVNSQAWINSNLVGEAFFDDNLFWELINNTYLSLALNEIGEYRIKEFVKPFWQSPERAIFVAKMPDFWKIRKDKLIAEYNFNNMKDQKSFTKTSLGGKGKNASFSSYIGHNDSSSIYLETKDCKTETRISSDYFFVSPDEWYSGIAFAKRESNPIYAGHRDGFIRLDFYSKNNVNLGTYVSRLLVSDDNWQELSLAGFSPAGSNYAKVSFQLDKCYPGEKYFIDDFQIYSSEDVKSIDKKEYPFYGEKIPKNFLWLPEL